MDGADRLPSSDTISHLSFQPQTRPHAILYTQFKTDLDVQDLAHELSPFVGKWRIKEMSNSKKFLRWMGIKGFALMMINSMVRFQIWREQKRDEMGLSRTPVLLANLNFIKTCDSFDDPQLHANHAHTHYMRRARKR